MKPTDEQVLNLRIEDGEEEEDIDIYIDQNEFEEYPSIEYKHAAADSIKFDFLVPGSFVALLSPSSGFEPFYLVEVLDKCVSETMLEDKHGHVIPAGMMHIVCSYFEKDSENKNYLSFKKSKNFDDGLILLKEICSLNDQRGICIYLLRYPLTNCVQALPIRNELFIQANS